MAVGAAVEEKHSLANGERAGAVEVAEAGEAEALTSVPDAAPASDADALFDSLMKHVGEKGPYQHRFNYLFNLVFIVFLSMPYLNIVLIMTVPDHWCHVPGRELTNFTLDQWKELTVPREESGEFSKCSMFNVSDGAWEERAASAATAANATRAQEQERERQQPGVVDCRFGWEYDTTWYTLTAPSQEDWVCGKAIYVSNVFAFSRAADVIGSFVFGQLGDSIGRRPVFVMSLVMVLLGRCLSVVSAALYPLFLFFAVVGSLSSSASFQSPYTVGIEMSSSDKRGHLAMLQSLGWTLGISLVPLIAWAFPHWVTMLLITTLPCAPFIFLMGLFPESPRWLASRGRTRQCRQGLERIARANGTSLPPDADATLRRLAERRERVFGVASLFSSRRLALNTALISFSWFINSVTYYTLMLNVSMLSGNPFLNYLWQSLVELPGYIVGQAFTDHHGRRWTQAGSFALLTGAYAALIWTIADPAMELATTLLVVFAKFCITITFYVIYLQCMEIYPTCVRQTGTAFATLVGSGMATIGPYILYLSEYNARYPYVAMTLLAASGAACSSFLPETLHQRLPETLAEAHHFGADQTYWQFRYEKVAKDAKEKKATDA